MLRKIIIIVVLLALVAAIIGLVYNVETGDQSTQTIEETNLPERNSPLAASHDGSWEELRSRVHQVGVSEPQPPRRTEADYRLALKDGSPQALAILRDEVLRNDPKYVSEILPRLRRDALHTFLQKSMSDAEQYVSNVERVNSDLGTYLRSAITILQALYRETKQGTVFDEKRYVESQLTQMEESLLGSRLGDFSEPRSFDASVLDNPRFHAFLELSRCELVIDELQAKPGSLGELMPLLASVKPTFCSKQANTKLARIIVRIMSEGSVELRTTLLTDELTQRTLSQFSNVSELVRRAVAELFVISAIDAVAVGDQATAETLLVRSRELIPLLESQEQAENLIHETFGRAMFVPRSRHSPGTPSVSPEDKKRERKDRGMEAGWEIPWGAVGIVLGILVAVGVVLYLRVRASDYTVSFVDEEEEQPRQGAKVIGE